MVTVNREDRPTDLLDRVRKLYPGFSMTDVRALEGHGQNTLVLVVDERLVFRFPRYADGVARLRREVALLRGLRPHVPLAIPDPVYVSLDGRVGRAFIGYPLIPGEPLWQRTLDVIIDDAVLGRLGVQVGEFLRALHGAPVGQLLPHDLAAFDRTAEWRNLYARIEQKLFSFIRPDARISISAHFQAFFDRAADLAFPPTLIHGDFGTGNILWDPSARIVTGVVDWSSSGVGDSAIDVAALPGSPAAFYRGLVSAYPAITTLGERVAFYRGTFALQEALFGIEQGDDVAFQEGIARYR